MPYIVYIQESETGRIESFGGYDKPPLIVAQDGSKFASIENFDYHEFLNLDN